MKLSVCKSIFEVIVTWIPFNGYKYINRITFRSSAQEK